MKEYNRMTDEELVAAYQQGDFEAVEYICRKYGSLVSKYGNQFFIKGSDKQDVIQEGMVGLFKAIQDYDDTQQVPFVRFAELCIRRQIYKAIESADAKKNQPLNSYVSIFPEGDEKPNREVEESLFSDENRNPENMMIDTEHTMAMAEKIMLHLSKMELEVFFYLLRGMDYHAIAEKMGKPEKNIDNAIQRIRQKVKKLLL